MDEKWKNLLQMAQKKNPNLKDPVLPYSDAHVVGDFNGIFNGNVNISWFANQSYESKLIISMYIIPWYLFLKMKNSLLLFSVLLLLSLNSSQDAIKIDLPELKNETYSFKEELPLNVTVGQ